MSAQLAYLAGLFDGDGSVRLQPRTRWRGIQLSVTMWGNNKAQVTPFMRFGGSVTQHRGYTLQNGEHRQMYVWSAGDLKAERMLRMLYPYLRVREAHARIASEFRALVRPAGPALTEETWREMVSCHQRLRSVIHRVPRRIGWWDARADLAYLAGLFDAEGCISFVHARNRRPYWSVTVNNVVDAPCLGFARYFGGQVYTLKAGKSIFAWQRTHRSAINTLRRLLPYLRVKRDQAQKALIWFAENEPTAERVAKMIADSKRGRKMGPDRKYGPRLDLCLVPAKEVS